MSKLFKFAFVFSLVLLLASATHAEEAGRAFYDLGVFAYDDGDYEEAEKNLKAALTAMPDNAFYNHYMGKTYLRMERYDEALAHLKLAYDVNPDVPGLKYDLALALFQVQDYSKSAQLFEEIAQENPSNILAHYHAGISLYKLEQYPKALDYFLKASEKSPSLKANGYFYAGLCYHKMGDLDNAVNKLEYARDNAEEESLKQYAAEWLAAIEKQKGVKPYSVYARLGYGYDSNVVLEPLDEDTFADEDDWGTALYFSGTYNFVDRQNYIIGAGYNHYQTWYNDLTEYNFIGSLPGIYGKYRLNPFTFGLSYSPNFYWLDSDDYLTRHHIRPDISWQVNNDLLTKLSYSYYDDDYSNDLDKGRDGHTNEVFLDGYYSIGDKKNYLFGGVGYEDKSANSPDQDYGQLKTRLGISLKIPLDLILTATVKYYYKDYDSVDSTYNVTRKDDKYYGTLSLSRKIFYDWLGVLGEYRYNKTDSNINEYSYDRHVIDLSLTASF